MSNYTTIKISTMPWLNKKGIESVKEVKGIDKNLIFKKCSEITDDPYWKKTLTDGYRNLFPSGVVFEDGILSSKIKEMRISDNLEEAYHQILNFFRTVCMLKSPMDQEHEKYQEHQNHSNYKSKLSWSDYKSKPIKKILILDYVQKLKDKYILTDDEFKDLLTLLNFNVSKNIITSNDIELYNGQISEINSLKWDNQMRKFYLNNIQKSSKSSKRRKYVSQNHEGLNNDFSNIGTQKKVKNSSAKEWNTYITKFINTLPYHNTSTVPTFVDVGESTSISNQDFSFSGGMSKTSATETSWED